MKLLLIAVSLLIPILSQASTHHRSVDSKGSRAAAEYKQAKQSEEEAQAEADHQQQAGRIYQWQGEAFSRAGLDIHNFTRDEKNRIWFNDQQVCKIVETEHSRYCDTESGGADDRCAGYWTPMVGPESVANCYSR